MNNEFLRRYNNYTCIKDDCHVNSIFHYTRSIDILLSILKERAFWVTDLVDFWTDDKLEGILILQQIHKLANVQNWLEKEVIHEFIGDLEKQRQFLNDHVTFVLSMCKNGQSEYMWKNYATNDGYVISFDKKKFLDSLKVKLGNGTYREDEQIFKRGSIVYDEETQKNIICKEYIELKELSNENGDMQYILNHLMYVGNYYKSSVGEYEKEEEYRILLNTVTYENNEDFLPIYKYNENNNKHYIEIFFSLESVNKIICGTKEAEDKLRIELACEGINIEVELREK